MKTFSIGRKLLVSYSVILALMCIGFGGYRKSSESEF